MARKQKSSSRPQRWADAIQRGQQALEALRAVFEDLEGLQNEYEGWNENLPENLQYSALAIKLGAVTELDLDVSSLDEIEGQLSEAENADLPLGFGRD